MNSQQIGVWRSLLMYYGAPWRRRRLSRFYSQFIRPGDLCFDVGAHLGNRLHAWLRLRAHVVAVEPQPQLMALLRRWYGRSPQVTFLEEAIGARPGSQTLFISRRTPTVTTLSAEWMTAMRKAESFAGVEWDSAVTVGVTTLDALIAQYGEPAFCKIDVEGYELEALRGLSRPLRALSFEYLPPTIDIALGCVERLAELGRYVYNWSEGESHRWRSAGWLTPEAMAQRLTEIPVNGRSGDVYARLVGETGR